LNRFWSQDPCQTGTLVKIQLLILIDILLATICVILPPASSVLQAGSSGRLCLYTRKRLPRERLRSSRHIGMTSGPIPIAPVDGQTGRNPSDHQGLPRPRSRLPCAGWRRAVNSCFHGTYPFDHFPYNRSPAQLAEHRHFSGGHNGMVHRLPAPTATDRALQTSRPLKACRLWLD
jgi:hypothetical protein